MDPQPPDFWALAARNFGLDVAAPGGPVVACDSRRGRCVSDLPEWGPRSAIDPFDGKFYDAGFGPEE